MADARPVVALAAELGRDAGDAVEPPADTADRLADLRRRYEPTDRSTRVRFEQTALAELMPPLGPGTLTVVGARLGMGKTAFAFNLAAFTALRSLSVYFVSLEMGRADLGRWLASAAAGLRGGLLRTGRGSYDQELARLEAVAAELRGLPLTLFDRAARPVERLVALPG